MALLGMRTRDGNGQVGSLRVEPSAAQGRRPKLSWIAVGLVVMVAAGLFVTVVVARVADREPVLAVARTLERGEALTVEDVRVVEVAVGDDVTVVPASQRDTVVGMVAVATLPEGMLLSLEQLVDGDLVPDGWRVVGLALPPGAYPVSPLRAGDPVAVVRTADRSASQSSEGTTVLVADAEVFAFEVLSEMGRTAMVSVVVPDEVAAEVASAAADDRIRLLLGGRS